MLHAAVLLAILAVKPAPPGAAPSPPVLVTLVPPLRPPPPPPPPPPPKAPDPAPKTAPDKPKPSPAKAEKVVKAPPPKAVHVRKPKTPLEPTPVQIAQADPTPAPMVTVSDSQLAGAATAAGGDGDGSGSGGGSGEGGGQGAGCNMLRRVQAALRADPDIRAAVARAHERAEGGRAILVWNGDWIQTPGEAGKGLAGVRQAIALEVAFAPPACREAAMRGMALITLSDRAGAPRLALGGGSWRWSDLLGPRGQRRR